MTWFKYQELAGGLMPIAEGQLILGNRRSLILKFLVDSGAAHCLVPRASVSFLLKDLPAVPERDTGLRDANGRPVMGVFVDFDVEVSNAAELPSTPQRFWVCSGVQWALLGQTWFEQFAVRFHNFPAKPEGRRFAMYPVP